MVKKTSWMMITVSALAVCFLLFASACNKKEEQPSSPAAEQPAAAPAATPIDPATVATVSGTVKFDGAAPKATKIDMSQDPACKGVNEVENIAVDGGNLANVFVYVKDGLGSRKSFGVLLEAFHAEEFRANRLLKLRRHNQRFKGRSRFFHRVTTVNELTQLRANEAGFHASSN